MLFFIVKIPLTSNIYSIPTPFVCYYILKVIIFIILSWHKIKFKQTFFMFEDPQRGYLAVYYTSPQSLVIKFLIHGDSYWIVIGWFIKLSVNTFQPIIVIFRKDSIVYHHWGCKSTYWPLSYPNLDPLAQLICTYVRFVMSSL